MHQIEIEYKGDLKTFSRHLQSGKKIITDAPIDNFGRGEEFSPTDLLVSALGSCILTIMGIIADRHSICIEGTRCLIKKDMKNQPRMIEKIEVEIFFNKYIIDDHKKLLERAAYSCPVHRSLHPDILKNIKFYYSLDKNDI